MVKKVTLILTLISVCAIWRGGSISILREAAAQNMPGAQMPGSSQTRSSGRGTKLIDYSKFNHSSHAGMVGGVLKQTKSQNLNCNYCHQDPTPAEAKVTGYPNSKPGGKITHSACIDCHLMAGRPEYPQMCLICHSTQPLAEMKNNVRQFPNPVSGPGSQFYDYYSHANHVGYFKSSKAYKEIFKDKTKFKEKDNFECVACHADNMEPTKVAGKEFAKGVKERAPGHQECFVCHFDEKEVDKKSPTFATNCVGCHTLNNKPQGTGSQKAVLWFNREIINTEFNKSQPKNAPNAKPNPPFNHEAHMADYDNTKDKRYQQGTQSCLICHENGKTATERSEFFDEFKKTMSRQPSATSCVPCHKAEMQKKIEAPVTIETAKCSVCHNLQTIKEREAKGIQLPPPSHFKQPPPPPDTLAANKKTAKAASAPAKPTDSVYLLLHPDATAPTPSPGPEPGKEDAGADAGGDLPPDPAFAGPRKPDPTGIVNLGETSRQPFGDQWGQHAKWGVVANFNHKDHTQPKYSDKCEDCHHTNKDAKNEVVVACLHCHQSSDNPITAKRGGGVSVEDAYHGVPDSDKAPRAGCVECHARYKDKHPDSKAPIKSPCSGCHTEKTARLDPRMTRPRRGDWVTANVNGLSSWIKSSHAPAIAMSR